MNLEKKNLVALLALLTLLVGVPVDGDQRGRAGGGIKVERHVDPDLATLATILSGDENHIHTIVYRSRSARSLEADDRLRRTLLVSTDEIDEFSFYLPSANEIYFAQGSESHRAIRRLLKILEGKPRSRTVSPSDNTIQVYHPISSCHTPSVVTLYNTLGQPISDPAGSDLDNMKCNDIFADYVIYLDGNLPNGYNRRVDLRIKAGELSGIYPGGYHETFDTSGNDKSYLYGFPYRYEFTVNTDLLDPADRMIIEDVYPRSTTENCSVSDERSETTGWALGAGVSFSAEAGTDDTVGASIDSSFSYSQENSTSHGVSCDADEYKFDQVQQEGRVFTIAHELNKLGRASDSQLWNAADVIPETFTYFCDESHSTDYCDRDGSSCEDDYGPCCEYTNTNSDYCYTDSLDTMPFTVTDGYENAGGDFKLVGPYTQDLVYQENLRPVIRVVYNPGFRAWHQGSDNWEMFIRNMETWDVAYAEIELPELALDWRDQRLFSAKSMAIQNSSSAQYLTVNGDELILTSPGLVPSDYALPFPIQLEHVFYPQKLGGFFFESFRIKRYTETGEAKCLGAMIAPDGDIRMVDCDSPPQAWSVTWTMKEGYGDQLCLLDVPELCLRQNGQFLEMVGRCEPAQSGCASQHWKLFDPIYLLSFCEYSKLEYPGSDCYDP